jgi:hypothetical protein
VKILLHRNFNNAEKGREDRFSIYLIITISTTIISWFVFLSVNHTYSTNFKVIQKMIALALALGFPLLIIADFILVIATLVLMRKVSRGTDSAEDERYQRERKWFFITLKLYAIIIITWPFDVFRITPDFNFVSSLTIDVLKLFSGFLIFAILVLRRDVRTLLFRKRRRFEKTPSSE